MAKSSKPRAGKALRALANTGRPLKEGERYPSGKLKPVGPNKVVLERRKAICADPTMATCPLDAAYANGWLSKIEYGAGKAYIAVHSRAGLGSPGAATQRDNSIGTGAINDLQAQWSERWALMTDSEVRGLRWNELTHREIAMIWDSALRDLGRSANPETAEEFAAEQNRRWRALNAAMTSIERVTVDSFCIRETWPRWFWERLEGRMRTRWEDERDILIGGLRAMARAMEAPRTPARVDVASRTPPAPPSGPRRVETLVYVDEAGQKLFEAERILKRAG